MGFGIATAAAKRSGLTVTNANVHAVILARLGLATCPRRACLDALYLFTYSYPFVTSYRRFTKFRYPRRWFSCHANV